MESSRMTRECLFQCLRPETILCRQGIDFKSDKAFFVESVFFPIPPDVLLIALAGLTVSFAKC